jgi:hypothetical protein
MDEFEITFGFDFGWKLKCVVVKLPNQIYFQTTLWNIGTEKIYRIFKIGHSWNLESYWTWNI